MSLNISNFSEFKFKKWENKVFVGFSVIDRRDFIVRCGHQNQFQPKQQEPTLWYHFVSL